MLHITLVNICMALTFYLVFSTLKQLTQPSQHFPQGGSITHLWFTEEMDSQEV